MTARSLALSAGLLLLAPAVAAAQPTTIFNGDAWRAGPVAAPGGGAFTPSNQQVVAFAKRSADGIAASETAFKAPEFETVWGAGLDARGAGVILTLRRHKPYQRARVSFRSADGTVTPSKTISAKGHSASGPALAVARDGSAIAAWAWHDPAGWVVQAATRPAGGQFGAPQTLSSPEVSRPFITLAVGEGGDAVAAWQYGGSYKEPEEPLMYAIAPAGQAFGAAAKLADGGGHSELDIAVGADGRMLASWQPTYYLTRGDKEPAKLFVADRAPGEGFGAPRQLNAGGPGFVDQGGPTVALTSDGTALVAWVKPTDEGHTRGVVEAYARPAGGDFGAGQPLSETGRSPAGLELATGRHGEAALVWWDAIYGRDQRPDLRVHASKRPAGGAFGAASQVSPDGEIALWPDVAVTDSGDALVGWVHNTSGGGSGDIEATVL